MSARATFHSAVYVLPNRDNRILLARRFNTGFGDYNAPFNYTANRAGADEDWNKTTGGLYFKRSFTEDYQLRGYLNGQLSDQALIPGEQFGIGGVRSVRGYEEREVTGDYGFQASLEGWSSPQIFDIRILGNKTPDHL